MDRCAAGQVHQLRVELSRALALEARRFDKTLVAAAQRSWARYEDAECHLEAWPSRGGSIQPLIYATCERTLLVSRINQIRTDTSTRSTLG